MDFQFVIAAIFLLSSSLLFSANGQRFPPDGIGAPLDEPFVEEAPQRRLKIPHADVLEAAAAPPPRRAQSPDAFPAGGFECPEAKGFFEDPIQCDKYWICDDFYPEEKLCEDGLVFDINKQGQIEPCDNPYNVDCGERTQMQKPTYPDVNCPRANGFFPSPDPTNCEDFHTCINKKHAGVTTCTPGLHFSISTGICNWPAVAGRKNCEKVVRTLNGFSCDQGEVFDTHGMKIPHPLYRDPDNCQEFYTCKNGVEPQKSSCDLGLVFNPRSSICQYPDEVQECNGWYQNHPEFEDYYNYYDDGTEQQAAKGTGA